MHDDAIGCNAMMVVAQDKIMDATEHREWAGLVGSGVAMRNECVLVCFCI